MAEQPGRVKKSSAAGVLLLLTLLPLLLQAAGPGEFIQYKDAPVDRSEGDWPLIDDEVQPFEANEPEVRLEATKKLWTAELSEKADSAVEAADLIEKIQARRSGSGLRRLRSACEAICPKCICGIILMPSLPRRSPKRAAAPKYTKAPPKPRIGPVAPKVTPGSKVTGGTTKAPPTPLPKEPVKKTKKWLHMARLESELPDFFLDEGGNSDAYKREVSDHDPLSLASEESHIGIE